MDRRLNPLLASGGQLIGAAVAVALVIGALFAGKAFYDRYTTDYVVTRRADDGRAVTQVVSAIFARAARLEVGTLTGTVQATASDRRFAGLLQSDRVLKAPFSVDYTLDLSRMDAADYRYDPGTRTLVVDAPDVTVGDANVDEARRTLAETRGLFVTRGAMEELTRRVSAAAQSSAQGEARKPERLAQARDNARRALAGLLAPPLAAAGVRDVRVLVSFPYERPGTDRERWDVTKAPDEVLANAR